MGETCGMHGGQKKWMCFSVGKHEEKKTARQNSAQMEGQCNEMEWENVGGFHLPWVNGC